MVEDANITSSFCRMVASDLRLLADIHAVELTRERMQELQAMEFPAVLALNPASQPFSAALQQMEDCVKGWPADLPASLTDELATDFADIYLNGTLHGSPNESVWVDDEELTCQQPMFDVREWYARHGLEVPNWRLMVDDHLVNQLLFIAYLMEKAAENNDQQQALLTETALFMDEHLLRWLLPFGQRVAARCTTAFYGSLCLLTAFYGEQLRDLLADILDVARPTHEEIEARMKSRQLSATTPQPVKYYPGTAPSW